jgi:hypothetical protein
MLASRLFKLGTLTSVFVSVCTCTALAQMAIAYPTKMNVLYIGVENPVRIMVDGKSCKDYKLALAGATITARGNCLFDVLVTPLTVPQRQMAYILSSNNDIVDSVSFLLTIIPDLPTGRSRNLIRPIPLSARSIYSVMDSLQYEVSFSILDFEVTRGRGKTASKPVVNKTAQFNSKVLELLRTAKSGDNFYFESIRAKGPDGYLRQMSTITVSVE